MSLFSIHNNKAKKIQPIKIGREKDIQKNFEENLNEILNITFLKSEYPTSFGGRIDSLGIDKNGSPVIIEYKRDQNNNVINQGLSYLKWLLDHRAEFENLVQKSKIDIKIDWNSPRVICVASSYNKFDLDTAELFPIKIELLKFRLYQNNSLLVEQETQRKVHTSTSKIFKKGKKGGGIKEKIKYEIRDHLSGINSASKRIFESLNEKITALDESIVVEPKAKYIAYKLTTNFIDIVKKQYGLIFYLNIPSGELDDPYNIATDLTKPKKGHWGNGDYEIKLKKEEDVEKAFELIKQSYDFNK